MSRFDSYFFIYKDSKNNWNIATNPKFIASHTFCRAIYKNKIRDFKQLNYICKKLSSHQNTFVQRHLIKELEIY